MKIERLDGYDEKFGVVKIIVIVKVKVDCFIDEYLYSLLVLLFKCVRFFLNFFFMSFLFLKRCKREFSDRDMKKVCYKFRVSGSSSVFLSWNFLDFEDYFEGKRI